jgi:hypothetical protein
MVYTIFTHTSDVDEDNNDECEMTGYERRMGGNDWLRRRLKMDW